MLGIEIINFHRFSNALDERHLDMINEAEEICQQLYCSIHPDYSIENKHKLDRLEKIMSFLNEDMTCRDKKIRFNIISE